MCSHYWPFEEPISTDREEVVARNMSTAIPVTNTPGCVDPASPKTQYLIQLNARLMELDERYRAIGEETARLREEQIRGANQRIETLERQLIGSAQRYEALEERYAELEEELRIALRSWGRGSIIRPRGRRRIGTPRME